jgi:hypothetical protein
MSNLKIRQALEIQLGTVTPSIETADENVSYDPSSDTPYQRISMLPAEPVNPSFGDNFHRESGIFQVLLCYPSNVGTGDIGAQAELIRNAFKRGNSFTVDGVTVQIERTPAISSGFPDGDRYCVPVRIRYFSNVTT